MPPVDWKQIRQEFETTDILLKDLAAKYDLKEGTVRSRKNREGWQRVATQDNATQRECNATWDVATPPESEPFPGQCAAIGHKSGQRCRNKAMPGSEFCRRHADAIENQCTAKSRQSGERCKNKAVPGKTKCKFHGGASTGPAPGTQNALKHGFFAKIFPDDEETRALVNDIIEKDPLDILWENIIIQYTAIARAQRIMFVRDRDDLTELLKREKETSGLHSDGWEKEYELQFAWDKHANFLKAQSTAMKTLDGLIQRYEEIIQKGNASELHKLRLEKIRHDMAIARERIDIEKEKANLGEQDTSLEVVVDYGDDDES